MKIEGLEQIKRQSKKYKKRYNRRGGKKGIRIGQRLLKGTNYQYIKKEEDIIKENKEIGKDLWKKETNTLWEVIWKWKGGSIKDIEKRIYKGEVWVNGKRVREKGRKIGIIDVIEMKTRAEDYREKVKRKTEKRGRKERITKIKEKEWEKVGSRLEREIRRAK